MGPLQKYETKQGLSKDSGCNTNPFTHCVEGRIHSETGSEPTPFVAYKSGDFSESEIEKLLLKCTRKTDYEVRRLRA